MSSDTKKPQSKDMMTRGDRKRVRTRLEEVTAEAMAQVTGKPKKRK